MQINDKIKEINDTFTEYGEVLKKINAELDKPSTQVNVSTLKSLYDQKDKVWKRRTKHLEELQVLVTKLNEDHQLKLEKVMEVYK